MRKTLTVVFAFLIFNSSAQVKPTFHSINTLGVATGKGTDNIIFQTVNGVKYKKWLWGIGFGGDYYQYRTYPLFIDTRRYFGPLCQGFAYGDLGYNFAGKNTPGREVYNYTSYKFSGGMYSDLGFGYRKKLSKKYSLIGSIGFSYKEMQNNTSSEKVCITTPCLVDYRKYSYHDGRVVVKAGVDF